MKTVPVKINPRKLRGPWAEGFALDLQTTGATFLGYDGYGHPQFDTARSPLGELLYRLKYRGDRACLPEIVETAAGFLRGWRLRIDATVPVPPSRAGRKSQPVLEVAKSLCELTGIRLCDACVKKVKRTAELKDVYEFSKRAAILQGAFDVDRDLTAGRRLLLFDDLYRSGATATAVTRALIDNGGAEAVFLLALTRTRRNP